MLARELSITLRGESSAVLARAIQSSGLLQGPLRPGTRVGVAVSGGADSVALLRLLVELRPQLGMALSVVHFNHHLRGKASDADEAFVAALAAKYGLTLHVGRANVAAKARREKSNLENAARQARYEFFSRLAMQGAVDVVATAHTMDDQAETVLAHIVRGTGIAGLAGIHEVAGCAVRPLLRCRRADLRRYLGRHKQKWREDATNKDATRNRARMRKKLLPLLEKQFNPAVVKHLAGLAERAREQTGFLETLVSQLAEKYVTAANGVARIALADLRNPLKTASEESQKALRAPLIARMVERVKTRPGQLLAGHVDAVLRLAECGETGKRVQLPGAVDAVKLRDALSLQKRSR
jgi:tRNA(Ile)-lysidine synthase